MPSTRKHLPSPAIWPLLAVLCQPVGAQAQSLQEVVRTALANYPSIASARYKTASARADVMRAKGAHWPQLSWSGTYNDYRSDLLSDRWIQTPVLNLNLWSGGRIQSDVERAEALTQAAQHQEHLTRDDVALLGSEAYLQWAHQKQMLLLARENLGAHEKILNDFHLISHIDTGRRIDLNQAQVRYDNARLALTKIEADLRTAAEHVARVLMAPAPVEPSGVEQLPGVPYTTLEQAQVDLNDQQPAIARLLAQCEAAQASVHYAEAQSALTVNLTHSKTIIPGIAQNLYVTQLQLNLPLIDGGTARGAVEAAQANLQSLQADLAETRLLLSEQLAAAWTNWQLSLRRADLGQAQTRTAQDLALGYEQQFRAGRRALLDLLNIQSDLYLYKVNAASALLDARLSQVRILASLGRLARAYSGVPAQITSQVPAHASVTASVAPTVAASPTATTPE